MTVSNYLPAHDSKTLIFVASEGAGPTGGSASLYSIGDDGKKMARIASGTPAPADSADGPPGRGGRGGFGGGRMSNLSIPRDGRTVYFQEGNGIFSVPMTGGGGGSAPASMMAAMAGGGGRGGMAGGDGRGHGARREVTGRARRSPTSPRSRSTSPPSGGRCSMTPGRTMKYRFYDAKMHNTDWDSARAKYKPLVEYVGDRYELLNLVNEMIGELNASPHRRGPRQRLADRPLGRRPSRADRPPRLRPRRRRRLGPLQGRPRLRGRTRRQGLDPGRQGQLPRRLQRQADQGGRRLLGIAQPSPQSQGRADPQRQARDRRLVEGPHRADRPRPPMPTSCTRSGSRTAATWPTSCPTAASATSTSRRWISPRSPASRRTSPSSSTRRPWSSTSGSTAGATSSRNSSPSSSSAPIRSGNPEARSRRRGRSPATSAPRSSSRTGGPPPMPRCSPPASVLWDWAR